MKQLVKLLINWSQNAKRKDCHVIEEMRKAKDYNTASMIFRAVVKRKQREQVIPLGQKVDQ